MAEHWISKVEVFEDLTLQELKEELNKFSKDRFVIATQVFPRERGVYKRTFDAIVYYKINPKNEKQAKEINK